MSRKALTDENLLYKMEVIQMKKVAGEITRTLLIYFCVYACLFFIWHIILYFIKYTGEERMSDGVIQSLITTGGGVIVGIITALVSLWVVKKKQTDIILAKLEKIVEDIGREKKADLTSQHSEIRAQLKESFGRIETRYEKDDSAYSKFTEEQHDIKNTLDNFSRNYTELVTQRLELLTRNAFLEEKNKSLLEEKAELEKSNKKLNKKLEALRSKPDREQTY